MRLFVLSSLALASLAPAQSDLASATVGGSPICFDEARQRLTAFTEQAIWEWDAGREVWGRLGVAPVGRVDAAVYAPWERKVVLVAGGQLRAFDGHSFETLAPMPATTTNGVPRLVADTGSAEIVALVPQTSPIAFAIYRFDGTTWQQGTALPPQRILLGEAYDPIRDVLVVDALQIAPTAFETWEWDGTAWALRSGTGTFHGRLAFDPGRQQVIGCRSSITWGWDGSTWTALNVLGGPGATISMTADAGAGRVFASGTLGTSATVTWLLDGSGWRGLQVNHARVSGARQLTFDERRARTVVYNGTALAEFDGELWESVTSGLPPQREFFGQTFDPARGETVVFGGRDQAQNLLGETWTWDGQVWDLATTAGPGPRVDALMAFDVARQRVMLVGGHDGIIPRTNFQDHWEWNGVSWMLVQANTPFTASSAAFGYDRARSRAVHVDGIGDTREFDGVQWTLRNASGLVPGRRRLVWNGISQRVHGTLRDATAAFREYDWDGTMWNVVGATRGDLVYDSTRGALLEYDESALRMQGPILAASTDYGNACGGQTIATSLTAFGRPFPGTDQLTLDLRADATQRPALIGFATNPGNIPLGNGCTLLLQNPTASAIWFTDQSGVLQLRYPIPADPALQGFVVDAQGVVLDPNSPAGIALTQGLELTIGS